MQVPAKNKIFYHRSWQRLTVAGFLIFCTLFISSGVPDVKAAVPAVLSYQGRLANSAGSLLGGTSGTTYYFKFSIWDASSGGNKLWPTAEPTAVAATVREGVFNINIGDTAAGYPDALDYAFDRADVFLKVEVSADNASFEPLTPRQRISASAFALTAGSVVSASSTITNLTGQNATTTNATSSNLYVSGNASTTNLFTNVLNAGSSFLSALLVNGSSTFQRFTASNSTTTNATTTNLHISGTASTTNLFANILTAGAGTFNNLVSTALTVSSFSGSGTRCLQTDNNGLISLAAGACGAGSSGSGGGSWSTTTSQVAGQSINYSNEETDIVAIGGPATTTAPIYFDPNLSFAKVFNQSFSLSSTTLQNFTFQNATGTHATTTSFAASVLTASGLSNTLVKANTSGQLIAAVAGSDYLASMTFSYPFRSLTSGEQATSTTLLLAGGLISTASSTLSDALIIRATTTGATSTDLYVSNLASTSNLRANTGFIGFLTSVFHSVTNLLVTGSSTLQNFTAQNSTTTNATSTSLFVSNLASSTEVRANTGQIGTLTAGNVSVNGSSTLQNFTAQNATTTNASSTNLYVANTASTSELRANIGLIGYINSALGVFSNILSFGSTTLQNFTFQNATGTAATTTNLAVSSLSPSALLKAGSLGSLVSAVSGSDYQAPITGSYPILFGSNTISLAFGTTTNNTWSGAQTFTNASTTLQNFTFQNATGTSATTTNFATTNFCLNGDCRSAFPAALTFAFPFKTLGTGENATNTTLVLGNGLIAGASSTLQNFTFQNATGTSATTTTFATNNFTALGSTTLQNFTASNSTTTNATSTTLYAENLTGTAAVFGSVKTDSIMTNTSGSAGLSIGSTGTPQLLTFDTIRDRVQTGIGAGSAAPVLFVFDTKNTAGDPTGVNGAMYYNSNTNSFRCYQDSQWQNCGNQATSTNLYVSQQASTTDLRANTATIGHLTVGEIVSGIINGQNLSASASLTGTLDVLGGLTRLANLLVSGSSTLQDFTAQNSTTTSATTTNLATANFCLSGDCRSAWPTTGSAFAWPFTTLGTGEQATSTTIALLNGFLVSGSSTISSFTAGNATTTNATSTSLYVAGLASTTEVRANSATIGTLTVGNCVGCGSGSSFAYPFVKLSTGENATSTTLEFNNGFVSTASSTLSDALITRATTTAATSTDLYVSNIASTSQIRANTGFIGFLTSAFGSFTNALFNGSTTLQNFTASNSTTTNATSTTLATGTFCLNGDCRTSFPAASSFAWPFTTLGTGEQATSTTLEFNNGFVSTASSTLTTFTFTNATGTSATTTNLATTNLCVNGDCRNAWPSFSMSFAFPFTKLSTGENATSTTLALLNGFVSTASSTLTTFTFTNATGTAATTTNFAITSLVSKILKTGADGSVGAAVAGSDYQAPISAAFPVLFNSNVISLGFGTTTNNTWSGAQTFTNASTTLQNFTAQNSTSTNATTTTLATNTLCIGIDCRTSFPAASTFAFPFKTLDTGENATSTTLEFNSGFVSTASSTLTTFTFTNSTGTEATTTNLYVSGRASTTEIRANTSTIGFLTSLFNSVSNLLVTGSSTLQNFTASNATTTNATSTTLATGTFCLNGDCRTAFPTASSFAWPFTKQGDNSQATATVLSLFGGFNATASSTISGRLNLNSLTDGGLAVYGGEVKSYATTTAGTGLTYSGNAFNVNTTQNIAKLSNLPANGFVKTSGDDGTLSIDTNTYLTGMTFAFPFKTLGTGENATSTTLEFNNGFVSTASSTLTTFTFTSATGTSATTTNLAATNFCLNGDCRSSFPAASTFAFPFKTLGTGENSTNTTLVLGNGFVSTASSTLSDALITRATTTGATSTDLYVSNIASTSNLRANTSAIGFLSSVFHAVTNLLVTGSSTLQNFTASNSTTTNATTTTLATNTLCIGTDCRTSFPTASTFAFPFKTLGTGENATSTTLEFNNGFVSTASSTLTSFTASNASTTLLSATIASTSQLQLSGKKDALLSVDANGWVVASSSIGNNQLQSSTISGVSLGGNLFALTAGTTLTSGGTYTGATARTFDIDLTHPNDWTGLQTFANATSTLFSSQYASTTILCISGDCRTSFPAALTFAFPFTKFGSDQSTTSLMHFFGGVNSTASSTIGAGTATTGLTINGNSTTTGGALFLSSTTLQAFTANQATTSEATTTTFHIVNNFTLDGTLSHAISVNRNSVAATAGKDLALVAGGATPGSTDKSGGNLLLSAGTSTGSGGSAVTIMAVPTVQGSATTDRSPVAIMTLQNWGGFGVGAGVPEVGIGTTNPGRMLDIYRSYTGTYVSSSGSATTPLDNIGNPKIGITNTSATNASMSGLELVTTNANSNGQKAYIAAVSTSGSGVFSPSLTFGIQAASNAFKETMRIDSSHNVGIGTTSPAWVLQIASSSQSSTFRPQLTISDSANTAIPHWSFANVGGNLYFATSSRSSYATSSVFALSLDGTTGTASTTNLNANAATIGNLTVTNCAGCAGSSFAFPFKTLSSGENATSTTLEFNNGFVSTASSTLTSFTAANASTTLLSATIASTSQLMLSGKKDALLSVDANGWVVASSSIGNNQLQNSAITINTAGPLGGGGAVSLGGTLNLTCTGCLTAMTFAFPYKTLGTGENSTNTTISFHNGIISTASSTFSNILALASSTFQALYSPSATATNLYADNLLLNGSSTFQKLFSPSATATNLYADNLLLNGSSTFQKLFSTSATGTNLYATNFLALGSSTLQNATSSDFFVSGLASTTNLRANMAAIGNLIVTSCTGCGSASTTLLADNNTFSGNNIFSQALTANGGVSIGANALTGTSGIINYTNFDVSATGVITVVGDQTPDITSQLGNNLTIGPSATGGDGLWLMGGSNTADSGLAGAVTLVGGEASGTGGSGGTVYLTGGAGTGGSTFGGNVTISGGDGTVDGVVYIQTDRNANVLIGASNSTSGIYIGPSTDTSLVEIGNGNTATGKIQTINIGAGTGVGTGKSVVTIGSLANASALTLQAGTGDINFFSSSNKLTAAGALTLSSSLTSAGLLSTASSTIGAGSAATGLTIFGGATTTGNFLVTGSSTLQALFSPSATGTNLYATNFLALGSSTLQSTYISSLTVGSCSGCSGGGFAWPFTKLSSNEQATTTTMVFAGSNSLIATASSTLASTTVTSLLAIKATTTDLYVSNLASTTNLRANTGLFGNAGVGTTSPFAALSIQGSGGDGSGAPYALAAYGGDNAVIGGGILMKGGAGTDGGVGGLLEFLGGDGSGTGATGGSVNILAGAGAAIGGVGGNVTIAAGGASVSGDVTVNPGGSGTVGKINLATNAGKVAIGSITPSSKLTINGDVLGLSSSTFQTLFSPSATATNLYAGNLLLNGSSTFQKLFSTSATGTNLYATNFLALASSSLASTTISNLLIQTSATGTNLYANNFTGLASSTFQSLFSTSATGTNLYATNFLALGSSTLQSTYISNLTVGSCSGCGGGGGNSKWATSTVANANMIYPAGGSWVDVLIGATATTSKARLEVIAAPGNGGSLHAFGSTTINTFTVSALANGESKVAVGSTSPMALFAIHASSTPTTLSRQFIFAIGSTSPGKTPTTLFGVDGNGRVYASSTRPTVGSCGTSPTIQGTDVMGRVTIGTGATAACVVTFTRSWGNAPFCIVTPGGGTGGSYKPFITLAATTTATTLNIMGVATTVGAIGTSPRIDKTVFHYYCQGNIE